MRMRWVMNFAPPGRGQCRRHAPRGWAPARGASRLHSESHLGARLDNVELAAGHGPFDVLGRAKHFLDFESDAGDGAKQVVAEACVPDQALVAVVKGPVLG